MKKLRRNIVLMLGLWLGSISVQAGTVVIVNASNTAEISTSDIRNIFLAKTKTFSNGDPVIPVNKPIDDSVRSLFEQNILNKSAAQLKSYWSKLVFTGKAVPPRESETDEDVLKAIRKDPRAIGYIDEANLDETVRVAISF